MMFAVRYGHRIDEDSIGGNNERRRGHDIHVLATRDCEGIAVLDEVHKIIFGFKFQHAVEKRMDVTRVVAKSLPNPRVTFKNGESLDEVVGTDEGICESIPRESFETEGNSDLKLDNEPREVQCWRRSAGAFPKAPLITKSSASPSNSIVPLLHRVPENR